jgi:hypothetical protein
MCHTQYQRGFRKFHIPATRIGFAKFKQNEADKSMSGSVSELSGITSGCKLQRCAGFFIVWLPGNEHEAPGENLIKPL